MTRGIVTKISTPPKITRYTVVCSIVLLISIIILIACYIDHPIIYLLSPIVDPGLIRIPCINKYITQTLQVLMKALKCKPSAQFAYNYTINVLSKCSNIISHRSSVFEVDTTAIDLRRSIHLSSILEGRHINRRSSKVDTSIFEDRRQKHRTDIPTIRHRILSTMAIHSYTIDIIGYVSIVSTVTP